MIHVRDLLILDTFKEFELVSGECGLDRSVLWPNIAQTVSIREWLIGGDVILMSGVGLEITEELLTGIITQASEGGAACIIMLIHPEHIASIPQTAIDEAVRCALPVFAAPWETKLSKVIGSVSMLVSDDRLEERMHNEFLDRLLAGEINSEDTTWRESMERYGLLGEKMVAVIDYEFGGHVQAPNQVYQNDRMMRSMIAKFEQFMGRINYINQYNRQTFIVTVKDKKETDIVNEINRIYDSFKKENPDVNVRIGVGESAQGLEGLKKSYEQSKIARKTINKSGVIFYKELGIYQLLFYIDDTTRISKYVDESLASILEYDEKYNQNLLDTLREYLRSSQNITQAAKHLYIHRNTMIKRVEKIEEVIGASLKDAQIANQFYNLIKMYDLFAGR